MVKTLSGSCTRFLSPDALSDATSRPGKNSLTRHWFLDTGKRICALSERAEDDSHRSWLPAAELPPVHLDAGVPAWGQDRACHVLVRRPDQRRRAQPGGTVIGQQRSVCDQLVPARRYGEVGRLPGAK